MKTAIFSDLGKESAARSEIALRKNQLHSWNGDHVGLLIKACEGTVWVTQANDETDIILQRGGSFRVNRPGRVVAQSLAPTARLVVQS